MVYGKWSILIKMIIKTEITTLTIIHVQRIDLSQAIKLKGQT